jgi:hypothetical protein
VQRGFGELADEPARDDRMVGRAGRIEEPFGEFVGVGVPARPERGEDPTDLREGDSEVRPGRHRDPLGLCRRPLGRILVTARPGDDRVEGVGCGDPLGLAELCRQAPALLGRRDRDVPVGEPRCRVSLQHKHARQMPEPSFGSEALDGRGEEWQGDVEGAHDHCCRPEKAGRVRVMASIRRGRADALQYRWRLPERVGIGLDGEHAGVC